MRCIEKRKTVLQKKSSDLILFFLCFGPNWGWKLEYTHIILSPFKFTYAFLISYAISVLLDATGHMERYNAELYQKPDAETIEKRHPLAISYVRKSHANASMFYNIIIFWVFNTIYDGPSLSTQNNFRRFHRSSMHMKMIKIAVLHKYTTPYVRRYGTVRVSGSSFFYHPVAHMKTHFQTDIVSAVPPIDPGFSVFRMNCNFSSDERRTHRSLLYTPQCTFALTHTKQSGRSGNAIIAIYILCPCWAFNKSPQDIFSHLANDCGSVANIAYRALWK